MSCLIILGVKMQAVEVDAQRYQHTQINLDELPLYDVEKEVQYC